MILYFIKTTALLGIFYSLYILFLKNNKSFQWNRVYLLSTTLFTLILPFLNSVSFANNAKIIQQNNTLSITLDTINIYSNTVSTFEPDLAKIILAIYIAGLLWGLLRMITGLVIINRIKKGASNELHDNYNIHFSNQIESPFSFNKNIFIPDLLKNKPELNSIITHELAHINSHHTRDKIFILIMQAIFWYNPFVYLIHKELELLHEFEADNVATKIIPKEHYIENLLQTITLYNTPTFLVHQFYHHPLKTRITMLYKKSKNALLQKSIVALTTLIICVITLFIQCNAQKNNTSNKGKYTILKYPNDTIEVELQNGTFEQRIMSKNPDTLYESVDIMPEFYGGEEELIKFITDNLKYPEYEAKNKIAGKVVINFVVDQNGKIRNVKTVRIPPNGENLAKEAIRIVNDMPKWKSGKHDGKPVKVYYQLPIVFSLKK